MNNIHYIEDRSSFIGIYFKLVGQMTILHSTYQRELFRAVKLAKFPDVAAAEASLKYQQPHQAWFGLSSQK